ncbi:FKBP-type peptidyl-prolyl cis-trans isomerase [Actinotalea sp. K2]|uniref:FKBP-type peptidyl-prolyl cis-trans isomerase n=1 Tax=Actinotalea sp. K2 TaxID=2939438 RepID=UPI002017CAEB|nr:FKBP-type peptidyl-prolyl cis-trans isomerase [Actinotalea sp. K2]MCL3861886.1 FKBP-type peptidyl-prolyl cis-trans isomerase [Actinotalea sp. K2]
MRRLTTVLTSLTVAAALLSGCSPEQGSAPEVVVTGEPGQVPVLEYEAPLTVGEARAEVVWEGEGPSVADGQPILVDYYAEAGADASLVGETFTSDPRPYLLSAEALGVDIYRALSGRTVGSRILHLAPPSDGQSSSTVAVFDLLPTRAAGEPVEPRDGLPTVELAENGEPTVTIPEGEPPSELVVQPLIKATGPQVEPMQVITVQFTGVRWSDGTVFDSSWDPGKLPAPFPIGVGSVIAGWDEGLVEQTVGSQVLLIIPPSLGYGGTDQELATETLVFVVDILAANGRNS